MSVLAAVPDKPRVALVIGNAAYKDSPLANPVNDATDVAAMLRKLGFDVIERTNATQKEMNRAISQFGSKLTTDTMGLFYFAGHGLQVRGKNYLVPVDADITSENSIRAETVDVDAVLDQLSVSDLNVVILDACRNNPFERKFRSLAGGGLAQMDAPKGSLIAYATAPGKTALDGKGRNGVFTAELLKQMAVPGLPVENVFKNVRRTVAKATGDQQIPWESSSLTGDFYFNAARVGVPGPATAQTAPTGPSGAQPAAGPAPTDEDGAWRVAVQTDTPDAYRSFMEKFPGSRFEATAYSLLVAKESPEEEDEPAPTADAAKTADRKASPAATPATPAAPAPQPVKPAVQTIVAARSEPPPAESKAAPAPPRTDRPATEQTLNRTDRILVGRFVLDAAGEPSGEGKIVWKTGAAYTGSIAGGKREGKGTLVTTNRHTLEGEWKNDALVGRALIRYPSGDRYEGEVRGELAHGAGRLIWADGDYWDGQFADGTQVPQGRMEVKMGELLFRGDFTYHEFAQSFSGNGTLLWSNGDRYDGALVKGVKSGKGTFVWANGQRYEGDWKADHPTGRGIITQASGDRYEGEVRDGIPHGSGRYFWTDGRRYEGTWIAGKRQGTGRMIEKDGRSVEVSYANDVQLEGR